MKYANLVRTRGLKKSSGSTLVEFAFVVTTLMIMLLGITEFSRALYAYHFVSNAAREASRYAAVRGSTCNNDGSCWNDGYCTDVATSACVGSYVNSLAPTGIDAASTGCGGSGCLTTSASWPTQTGGPTVCSTTSNSPGCTVQVQVSYQFQFLFPFIRSSALTLTNSSSMIITH